MASRKGSVTIGKPILWIMIVAATIALVQVFFYASLISTHLIPFFSFSFAFTLVLSLDLITIRIYNLICFVVFDFRRKDLRIT